MPTVDVSPTGNTASYEPQPVTTSPQADGAEGAGGASSWPWNARLFNFNDRARAWIAQDDLDRKKSGAGGAPPALMGGSHPIAACIPPPFGVGVSVPSDTSTAPANVLEASLSLTGLKVLPSIQLSPGATGGTLARIAELQGSIPAAQQGRITMGVGMAKDANGARRVLVGTSEPRGYLRPGVTLAPGEIVAPGLGHAEADIVNFAQQNGLRLLEVGATRPICPACAALIEGSGARAVTPLKGP